MNRFSDEIIELTRKNPIVHSWISFYLKGHGTYLEALEQIVIALAQLQEVTDKKLIAYREQLPPGELK